MTIRCICVDDEPMARKGLSLALAPFSDFEMVAAYPSGEALLASYPADIDVIFIDIEMPRLNGFQLLAQLPEPLPLVVFVTAYNQYAIKAFEAQALDYILKPIEELRFAQVIKRIKNQLLLPDFTDKNNRLIKVIASLQQQIKKDAATISVKTDDGYFSVKLSDLQYLESVGDHVCLHLQQKQLITRNTLKSYVAELEAHGFYQIHRSTLVNAKHIIKTEKLRFGDHQITLSNGKILRVSRRYKAILEHFSDCK